MRQKKKHDKNDGSSRMRKKEKRKKNKCIRLCREKKMSVTFFFDSVNNDIISQNELNFDINRYSVFDTEKKTTDDT